MLHNKYIRNVSFVSGLFFLSTCINSQANDGQGLDDAKTLGKQTTYQLSQNSNSQTDSHTKNRKNSNSEIDLSASDYVSAHDKSSKNLFGLDVDDKNNNEVGVVYDLLLNNNKIVYIVVLVKYPAALKEEDNKKFVAVPFHKLRFDNKSELSKAELKVILNITKQQANQMPEFRFNSKDHGRADDDNVTKIAEVNYDISAKELIGKKVFGKDGRLLGVVEDLIINNKNKAKYAIILASGVLSTGDKLVAAPFQKLQINKMEEKVMLDVTSQELEDAPGFQIRKPR